MGLGRLWYGKKGQNLDLSGYMMWAGIVCFAAYLTAALASLPLLAFAGCMISGLSVGIMWPGSISLTSARMPGGGMALFALLALAGDAGGTFGPSLVGLCTRSGGNDLQSGILAAAVFPALLVLCLLAIRRREARKNP
jgi:MFS-type transporter involved in bile tolerance (Atg22 family)